MKIANIFQVLLIGFVIMAQSAFGYSPEATQTQMKSTVSVMDVSFAPCVEFVCIQKHTNEFHIQYIGIHEPLKRYSYAINKGYIYDHRFKNKTVDLVLYKRERLRGSPEKITC